MATTEQSIQMLVQQKRCRRSAKRSVRCRREDTEEIRERAASTTVFERPDRFAVQKWKEWSHQVKGTFERASRGEAVSFFEKTELQLHQVHLNEIVLDEDSGAPMSTNWRRRSRTRFR